MSIQKLKIATYCMMKKAQGYKLLKNPKGTPATTVKVLKYSDSINPKTLDISKSYETITKDFSKYNSPETTTNLDIEKYAFFNKKIAPKYTRYSKAIERKNKRNILYKFASVYTYYNQKNKLCQ